MERLIQSLEKRVAALLPPKPWSFEQFRAAWDGADELSWSLFETMASCPGLFPGEDCLLIRGYLERMGIPVEQAETIILESDLV
jgi:hypothetical protein